MSKDEIVVSTNPEVTSHAYLGSLPEKSLAEYQHNQVGNTCTLHCISEAIQFLTGKMIFPVDLAEEIDALPFFERLPYRWWKDGPVSPIQQVYIIRKLTRELELPLSVKLTHPKPFELISIIGKPGTAALVTIGWMKGSAPVISLGEGISSYTPGSQLNWHTMFAAAYDPQHRDHSGQVKPWGFINSWVNQGNNLFWISDNDFIRSWSFYTPFGGCRSTVVITLQP